MHIAQIKATEKIQEAWGLLQQHRNELATYKGLMVLKPDIEKYKILEDSNNLFALALYDNDTIVGYSVFIITTALHYSDLIIAQNDVLYIHPDYRSSKWGMKLIAESERMAKDRGIKMIMWHGKEATAFSQLMPRLGYIVQDIMFSKEL